MKYYLRYGDDFILIHDDLEKLEVCRKQVIRFLEDVLKLKLNPKNDVILKPTHGLKFLGVVVWPGERKLNKRVFNRVKYRLCHKNIGSYYGLTDKHGNRKLINNFSWRIFNLLNST